MVFQKNNTRNTAMIILVVNLKITGSIESMLKILIENKVTKGRHRNTKVKIL